MPQTSADDGQAANTDRSDDNPVHALPTGDGLIGVAAVAVVACRRQRAAWIFRILCAHRRGGQADKGAQRPARAIGHQRICMYPPKVRPGLFVNSP